MRLPVAVEAGNTVAIAAIMEHFVVPATCR